MKIAYIVENFGKVSETFVTDLVEGLASGGDELRIFEDCPLRERIESSIPLSIESTGYATHTRKTVNLLGRIGNILLRKDCLSPLRRFISYRAFLEPLRRFMPEVAYIDHGQNAVLSRRALVELGIPFVVHFHGRDASQLFGSIDYCGQINGVYADAAKVIVASEHIRRRLALSGCAEEKIELVRLGVDTSLIEAPDWMARKELGPSIVHVGRLVEKKNPLALLHAFAIVKRKISNATLIIVGDGPLRALLKKRIETLGLEDSVRLYGALPREEALAMIRDSTLYAQHCVTDSRGDQEGFNVTFLEAAANGLPVVSTIHDGIPENVVDGETGCLVPEYNYEAMAQKIIWLLSNPDELEKMGRAGRDRAERLFPLEKRIEGIRKVLSEAAKRGG